MKKLFNIEFYNAPAGKIEFRNENGVRTYKEEDTVITDEIFTKIEEDYPDAFKALSDKYVSSKHNIPYFKYKIVRRFIRCNFGRYDNVNDVDDNGNFNFEYVACPMEGECPLYNVVCNPKFNTNLSIRELEVMRMYASNYKAEEIADKLFLSADTVRTHKRNAMQRVGTHTLSEFIDYSHRNKIFKED